MGHIHYSRCNKVNFARKPLAAKWARPKDALTAIRYSRCNKVKFARKPLAAHRSPLAARRPAGAPKDALTIIRHCRILSRS